MFVSLSNFFLFLSNSFSNYSPHLNTFIKNIRVNFILWIWTVFKNGNSLLQINLIVLIKWKLAFFFKFHINNSLTFNIGIFLTLLILTNGFSNLLQIVRFKSCHITIRCISTRSTSYLLNAIFVYNLSTTFYLFLNRRKDNSLNV